MQRIDVIMKLLSLQGLHMMDARSSSPFVAQLVRDSLTLMRETHAYVMGGLNPGARGKSSLAQVETCITGKIVASMSLLFHLQTALQGGKDEQDRESIESLLNDEAQALTADSALLAYAPDVLVSLLDRSDKLYQRVSRVARGPEKWRGGGGMRFPWPTEKTGLPIIDEYHAEMGLRMNLLYQAVCDGLPEDEILSQAVAARRCAAEHFVREERAMRELNYFGLDIHSEKHVDFMGVLDRFITTARNGQADRKTAEFLIVWGGNHATLMDAAFIREMMSQGG